MYFRQVARAWTFSRGSSRQRGATCSTKMSDESCGLGTAWWTSAESEGSVHSCRTPWMQDTPLATELTCHCVRPNEVASKSGRVSETHHSCVGRAGRDITISSGVCCRSVSGPASSWWKSVSDVSLELERVDDLASLCSTKLFSCVLVKERKES